MNWQGQELEHSVAPKYLGVRLDRSLTFRRHCEEVEGKVCSRNNILRKLTNTKWGAQPHVLRTSALAICLSAAEYAAPVWYNSAHAKKVDVAVNETTRIISGCLKPTPVKEVYPTVGIAPPSIRRRVAAEVERGKQITDPRHPMYGSQTRRCRLKSRRSFLETTSPLEGTPETRRVHLWRDSVGPTQLPQVEEMAAGNDLPYPTWRSLNRLRTGVSRCYSNLKKWGYTEEDACECGAVQDHSHLFSCPHIGVTCTPEDALLANDRAIRVAEYWRLKI